MTPTGILVPIRKPGGDFVFLELTPEEAGWPRLRAVFGKTKARLPVCFAPPEEKLEVFFFYACKAAGLPTSIATVFNPGWSEMFMNKIQHDCLVVSDTLVPYLSEHRLFGKRLEQFNSLIVVETAPPVKFDELKKGMPGVEIFSIPHPAFEFAK